MECIQINSYKRGYNYEFANRGIFFWKKYEEEIENNIVTLLNDKSFIT